MGALTGQQRPGPSDSCAVERGAIFVFAVAVAIVAIPRWTVRKVYAEKLIDDLDGVQDSRIVGRAQAEADERERIRTDNLLRGCIRTIEVTILDGHEAQQGRGGSVLVGWRRDADVVTFDSDLAGEIGVDGVGPAFDVVIPRVGDLAEKFRGLSVRRAQ